MGAPVAFVVGRHLLHHPNEGPAAIARHCHLHPGSVSSALKRLGDRWRDEELVAHLQGQAAKPRPRRFAFRVPNPDQFLAAARRSGLAYWLSGEHAAAIEGHDIVPERCIVYVRPDDMDDAVGLARSVMGRVAAPRQANVEVRLADEWLYLDPNDELVERGQRLLDYAESRNIQILRSLARG